MSWEEAAEMHRGGMSIGSHTHTHRILSKLSLQEQNQELGRSREILWEKLAIRADTIAYPVGSPATFNGYTGQALLEQGYKVAFSNYGGVNYPRQIRPENILRIGMHRDIGIQRFRLRTQLAAAVNRIF
jgi:peptidoglycan/xylan/chitin deacetylase (PgdA/CDA1 family)